MSNPVEYRCDNCGEIYDREYPVYHDGNTYCSDKCESEFKQEKRERSGKVVSCEVCGGDHYRTPSGLEKADTYYCSKECQQKHSRMKPPSFYLEGTGNRPRIRDGINEVGVFIHQLVPIAHGADPYEVFNSDYNVHHKNGCKLDNRPSNLEVIDISEHGRKTFDNQQGQYSTGDLLFAIQFMLNPSEYIETE